MAAICAAAPQLAARAAVSGYVLDRARARVSRTQTRWFGKCVTSDARAMRCRDRSSSRVAAPHARATSRLTAPSPSPASYVTANSPPRPRRRLASPSACARRYVPTRARTASEPRRVVFEFPSRVFPARVFPRPRRRTKAPRADLVDRSAHARTARSAHRRVPVPERHRTKPLPRRRRSPRRRSPSPSAPPAAPRCDPRRDALLSLPRPTVRSRDAGPETHRHHIPEERRADETARRASPEPPRAPARAREASKAPPRKRCPAATRLRVPRATAPSKPPG